MSSHVTTHFPLLDLELHFDGGRHRFVDLPLSMRLCASVEHGWMLYHNSGTRASPILLAAERHPDAHPLSIWDKGVQITALPQASHSLLLNLP